MAAGVMGERIFIYDTTLRDGGQTQGVDFGAADKAAIARELDALGVDYIEAGWPGANPTDDATFASPPELTNARLVAFGMTRRSGRSAENDPGLAAVVNSGAPVACLVGKAWDFHVETALGIETEENIAMIAESIAYAKSKVGEAMFDAEHFFDGYKDNPEIGYPLRSPIRSRSVLKTHKKTPMYGLISTHSYRIGNKGKFHNHES